MRSRGVTPRAFEARASSDTVTVPRDDVQAASRLFRDGLFRPRHHHRFAPTIGGGLRHLRLLGCDNGQVAVRQSDGGDLHLFAGDDGSGALVDDHARGVSGVTSRRPNSLTKPTTLAERHDGTWTATVPASSATALAGKWSLMTRAMALAVK